MKERVDYIPINNEKYKRINYKISGILKELSYKYKARKYTNFKRFKSDNNYKQRINKYWGKYNIKKLDYYSFYSYRHSSGVNSEKFIPEYLFYRYIEPKCSKLELARAYADKNLYDKRFGNIVKTPKTIIRNMNGIFYDENYNEISYDSAYDMISSIEKKYLIKPSLYSGSGRNISSIEKREGKLFLGNKASTCREIFSMYNKDYCIQEIIKQNNNISKFNSDTVNTIKIFTARVKNEIVFLNSYARFGIEGFLTDNYGSGGIYCGMNREGVLNDFAYRMYEEKYEYHPDSKYKFEGYKYPGFFEIVEKAKKMHRELPYFKFATWDMTLDKEGNPVLVETNLLHQDINGYQLQNGPLFGEYTDRILTDTFLK